MYLANAVVWYAQSNSSAALSFHATETEVTSANAHSPGLFNVQLDMAEQSEGAPSIRNDRSAAVRRRRADRAELRLLANQEDRLVAIGDYPRGTALEHRRGWNERRASGPCCTVCTLGNAAPR